eukprot:TRINITY_DN24321_c0_g1_i1.p1 TRINITY_DN24321_c0_g1~~TRINITY_DN24321_c0_g1_i1.p1  ORF type:complete len:271 (+),score=73.04 TRINITY_DN24321_c0_g1_i1:88-813(+)
MRGGKGVPRCAAAVAAAAAVATAIPAAQRDAEWPPDLFAVPPLDPLPDGALVAATHFARAFGRTHLGMPVWEVGGDSRRRLWAGADGHWRLGVEERIAAEEEDPGSGTAGELRCTEPHRGTLGPAGCPSWHEWTAAWTVPSSGEVRVLAVPPRAPGLPQVSGGGAGGAQPLKVGGEGVEVSELGPVIINEDGTISRIDNWADMEPAERERVKRRIVQRNSRRREALRRRQREEGSALGGEL